MQEPRNERNLQNDAPLNQTNVPQTKKIRAFVVVLALFFLCTVALICCIIFGKGLFSSEEIPTKPEGEETKTETPLQSAREDDEIRGVYIASVSNINFPSRAGLPKDQLCKELDAIVENSRRIGFDTIYFQVRPSADALYDSALFPTSRYLSGKEGKAVDLDPLAYLIEQASKYDVKVVAWVNPYRVTAGKFESKEAALASLSNENFAKKNPEHTVFYGGKLYFNPASEEVRRLIADGVREICEGYDVAGVLYDDYFYPYPVSGETFDDAADYEKSDSALSLSDWRRENVNKMVKLTYDTVKDVSKEMTFGISPFGIWKNSSSDPRGSDTRGLEAYSSLYCDALAWIEGEYVDYISPQIYWERGYSVADFSVLTRWWSAQVDGTKVKLVISHAAYRAGSFGSGGAEISQQIQYARNFMGSAGNIQYGYADIVKNTAGVADALTDLYREPYNENSEKTTVEGVAFIYPGKGVKTSDSARFVTAVSNPRYPVYSETGKIGRTKSGFFSVYMPLAVGSNTLTLTQNGVNYSLSVTRLSEKSPDTLGSFQIKKVTPSVEDGVLISSGGEIPVSVTAPKGCHVSVRLGDKSVMLTPTLNQKGNGTYLREVYSGSIDAPFVSEGTDPVSVGRLVYSVSGDGGTLKRDGAQVQVIPASRTAIATVNKTYSALKKSTSSSVYDDYTHAETGMTDEVVASFDGYYQLAFGGFVSKSCAALEMGDPLGRPVLTEIAFLEEDKSSDLKLTVDGAPPIHVVVKDSVVHITIFSTDCEVDKTVSIKKHRLFSSATAEFDEDTGNTVVKLVLKDARNYYGFVHRYEKGSVVVSFVPPSSLESGSLPLKGKRIALDAGHGGTDMGALGYLSAFNEKDLNLSIALVLRQKLEALGAEVLMTRSDDSTVALSDRANFMQEKSPDFSISIHHNSSNEAKDANKAAGALGLYWSPAGSSLAQCLSEEVADALVIPGSYRSQKLAMCRNHRFPQALIETSFICSPAEYERAMRSDYAEVCAEAMAQGVLDWYRMQEGFLKGKD